MPTWNGRITVASAVVVILAAAMLTLIAAAPNEKSMAESLAKAELRAEIAHELYVRHLIAWRKEKAARQGAEDLAAERLAEIETMAAKLDELSAIVDPLRERVAELEQYEYAAQLVDRIDELARQRSALWDRTADARKELAAVKADLSAAYEDSNNLASILEKYGTSGVKLNRIVGTSMEPTYGNDDAGLLMKTRAAPLKVGHESGDIGFYTYPEGDLWNPADPDNCTWRPAHQGLVAHRAIERRYRDGEWEYRFKGDNNNVADGCWVPHSQVMWMVPADGIVQSYLRGY